MVSWLGPFSIGFDDISMGALGSSLSLKLCRLCKNGSECSCLSPMFILASSIVFFKKLQTVLVAAKPHTTESKSICTAQEGQLKLEKKIDDERYKQYLEINK